MQLDTGEARARFASGRVARLATVASDGRPHLVPVVFAVVGERIVTAVDAKPKSTSALRRLAHIAAHPAVSVLVDHYAEDWTQLWWVRADGEAHVETDVPAELVLRYEQYREQPPPGPTIVIDVQRWSGWAFGPVA
jgi:PPOX class probable F420-dependent enzyme